MKKMFVLLWCALSGCSIIPDDAFERIPNASLEKITIQSNVELYINNPPSVIGSGENIQTLIGNVTSTPGKMSVEFEGELNNLDPFWFVTPVKKIDYDLSSEDLPAKITITFENGATQTEEFAYNNDGKLLKAVIKYGIYVYTFDFVYQAGELMSISKEVKAGAITEEGFYQKVSQDGSYITFVAIFPYKGTDSSVSMDECSFYDEAEVERHIDYMKFYEYGPGFTSIITLPNSFDGFTRNHSELVYNRRHSLVIDRTEELKIYPASYVYGCGGTAVHQGLSYYQLLPLNSDQLEILTMLNASEEIRWLSASPSRITPFETLVIDYQYTYAQ